jgi:hypothetical protein
MRRGFLFQRMRHRRRFSSPFLQIELFFFSLSSSPVARPSSDSQNDSLLSSTFAIATEQASKLRLGKNQTITSFFNQSAVLQIQHFPLIATLVGDSEVNLGALNALIPDIRRALDSVKRSVQDSGKAEDQ